MFSLDSGSYPNAFTPFRPLKHVGVGACAAARKPAVPTRTDICYGVVDREIVATKCA